MEHEVSGLLGASDEEDWDWEGLFKTVDELCELKAGQRPLINPLIPLEKMLQKHSSHISPKETSTGKR
jgi:hypothetical protein